MTAALATTTSPSLKRLGIDVPRGPLAGAVLAQLTVSVLAIAAVVVDDVLSATVDGVQVSAGLRQWHVAREVANASHPFALACTSAETVQSGVDSALAVVIATAAAHGGCAIMHLCLLACVSPWTWARIAWTGVIVSAGCMVISVGAVCTVVDLAYSGLFCGAPLCRYVAAVQLSPAFLRGVVNASSGSVTRGDVTACREAAGISMMLMAAAAALSAVAHLLVTFIALRFTNRVAITRREAYIAAYDDVAPAGGASATTNGLSSGVKALPGEDAARMEGALHSDPDDSDVFRSVVAGDDDDRSSTEQDSPQQMQTTGHQATAMQYSAAQAMYWNSSTNQYYDPAARVWIDGRTGVRYA
jgi:hypothetical protein